MNFPHIDDREYTTEEAAAYLGATRAYLSTMIARGTLASRKVPNPCGQGAPRNMFRLADLYDYKLDRDERYAHRRKARHA